jgi:hypothetical protein
MEILHQLGHKKNWNAEVFYENQVGDGFIFCAYSNEPEVLSKPFYKHPIEEVLPLSFLDLQYYGGKQSTGGKLTNYEFHPINRNQSDDTETSLIEDIVKGISFQIEKGLKKVIIPHIYNTGDTDYTTKVVKLVNEYLKENKVDGVEYFMTLPFSGEEIKNSDRIEVLLQNVTDMHILFDGYYVVCEQNLTGNRKISEDIEYYENLSRIFQTLKGQGFKIIHGYANVDSLVFSAITDIDYVSIGSYEVQRNFNIQRYIEDVSGGGSKGWYYSEKLLGFVRSQELVLVRKNEGIPMIANDENIFSDTILQEEYDWNIHKPEVHKNYMMSVANMLKSISDISDRNERIGYLLEQAVSARNTYKKLEEKGVFFSNESSGYHLPFWQTVLTQSLD